MAMDFFAAQDQARRGTRRLVLWFTLAVLTLVLLTNLLLLSVLFYGSRQRVNAGEAFSYSWEQFSMVSLVVIGIVLIGTLYKILQLRGGGAVVAEAMGGQLVVSGSGDLARQRLLNVVEEMAIASGTPVPPVYVIEDEPAINAFAAGYEPGDAVVAVTSGTLQALNREELQGVIAHEFSHILNGDMRLNIRLIGILHGILVIGLIGEYLLRGSRHGSSRNKGGGAMLGLGLMAIGYGGTLFGNIIKAAVSREREFLADASAVQFTRNPDGIGGALKQIGASSHGSVLETAGAAEISHAWFGEGVHHFFTSLFATHPPLEDRIRRVLPRWDGDFGQPRRIVEAEPAAEPAPTATGAGERLMTAVLAATVIDEIGRPGQQHLDYARALLQDLPEELARLLHEPHGARAVIFALVLETEDTTLRQRQIDHVREHGDKGVPEALDQAAVSLQGLDPRWRLPLLNIAIGSLRQLSKAQYALFKSNLDALVEMDGKVSLSEWCLRKIVVHGLDRAFGLRPPVRARYSAFKPLADEIRQLLSLMIFASRQQGISVEEAFARGVDLLELPGLRPLTRRQMSLGAMDQALDRLNQLRIYAKSRLLKACAAVLTADQTITAEEAELFRAVAEILDCPVPPLQETADAGD